MSATSSAASTQIVNPSTPKLAMIPAMIIASIDLRPSGGPVDVLELEPERELVQGQPVPIPKTAATISRHGGSGLTTMPTQPTIIISRIPQTR